MEELKQALIDRIRSKASNPDITSADLLLLAQSYSELNKTDPSMLYAAVMSGVATRNHGTGPMDPGIVNANSKKNE